MPPKKNHIGERYGYLEVIAEAPPKISGVAKKSYTCWWVLCHNCGSKKIMQWQHIAKAKSCGCINANTIEEDKTCEMCGATFQGSRTTVYCPECRKKRIAEGFGEGKSPVQISVKCEMCGKIFTAGTVTAKHCPDCRKVARQKANLAGYYRKKDGKARKIGEEYSCASCGKPFILKSGFQKYCPECEERRSVRSWDDFREKYPGK